MCVCARTCVLAYTGTCTLIRIQLFMTPWPVAHQAPLSMEFSRQEYGSLLPFPPPGDLPDQTCVACISRWIIYHGATREAPSVADDQRQTHNQSTVTSLSLSARAWCTGKTQRNWVEREVGGGIGMGNTCKSMADSCQCMTKTTTIL